MLRKALAWIGAIPAAEGMLAWSVGYLFNVKSLHTLDLFSGRGGMQLHVVALFFGALFYLLARSYFPRLSAAKVRRWQLVLRAGAVVCLILAANYLFLSLPEAWTAITIPRFWFTKVVYVIGYSLLGAGVAEK
jgi:hypothetical protein